MRRRVGRPGLLGVAARTAVVAGTASAVSGRVQSKQQGAAQQAADAQAADEQQASTQAVEAPAVAAEQPAAAPQPEPSVTLPAGDEMITQLERLGALHQSGVLTDEEFAAQKARLLGG